METTRRGRRGAGTTAAGVLAAVLTGGGGAPARADSADCVNAKVRAGATNNKSSQSTRDINGVKGMIDVPYTPPRNVTSGYEVSAADVYTMIDDAYDLDFVQFGWVYGYTDSAHGFQPVYRPFLGEWVGDHEELKFAFNMTLQPGESYYFELRRYEGDAYSPDYGKWFGFIDGVSRIKSTYTHLGGYAATNGEVNYRCHGLRNSNVEQTAAGAWAPTLKARRRSTGVWYTWSEHYNFTTDYCYVATRYYDGGDPVPGTANDYSSFSPSCPQN